MFGLHEFLGGPYGADWLAELKSSQAPQILHTPDWIAGATHAVDLLVSGEPGSHEHGNRADSESSDAKY